MGPNNHEAPHGMVRGRGVLTLLCDTNGRWQDGACWPSSLGLTWHSMRTSKHCPEHGICDSTVLATPRSAHAWRSLPHCYHRHSTQSASQLRSTCLPSDGVLQQRRNVGGLLHKDFDRLLEDNLGRQRARRFDLDGMRARARATVRVSTTNRAGSVTIRLPRR